MKKMMVVIIAGMLSACDTYSEGDRVGVVTKLSRKGVFCKTYEATMLVGGVTNDDKGNVIPQTWDFTVAREDVLDKVKKAQEAGKRVKIAYRQEILLTTCSSDSGYFAEDIQVIE